MSKKLKEQKEYLIKRNGVPFKCMNLNDNLIARFMEKLSRRFPDSNWSVSARFPIYGSD